MGALSHLRIVEIGSSAATSYCARLFADFGATVQKIEPPQGDPLRRIAPLTPGGHSAWFAFLNFNKSSVALDPKDPNATFRLAELIGTCDILIDGRDVDAADCPAFDLKAIKQRNPGLLYVEASWFGGEGPYANFAATDSTIRALTGLIKLVGPADARAGFPDRDPCRPLGFHCRRLVGGRPHAGWARPIQSLEHFRVLDRRHRIHHVRVVFAWRHHAADRRQPVLADFSGRHLRNQARLARSYDGNSRAVARLLRDA